MAKRATTLHQAAAVKKAATSRRRPEFECIAFLLQGGGALGAYQAGAYEALAEADLHPDWVAGISIGAINSAIIAGNAPEHRVGKLRQFWEGITASPCLTWTEPAARLVKGEAARRFFNQTSAWAAAAQGVPGFFAPRMPPPPFSPDGSMEATSWYDTTSLRQTLERLVDFERLNHAGTRVSLGSVNVRTGNFVYFDTETHVIGPAHVQASGALPPGFPAVEIEGAHYWDGGLVSNTPLQWVLQQGPRQDTLAFQVDLWSARGEFPSNLTEVATRQKEITYSSRTRDQTDRFRHAQRIRHAVAAVMEEMPDSMKQSPQAKLLLEFGDRKVYNIVHLIYRAQRYEGDSKDYEFSRLSMEEHWRAGYYDTVRSLRHPEVLERPTCMDGVETFDFANDDDG
jgi:NTE family protein